MVTKPSEDGAPLRLSLAQLDELKLEIAESTHRVREELELLEALLIGAADLKARLIRSTEHDPQWPEAPRVRRPGPRAA